MIKRISCIGLIILLSGLWAVSGLILDKFVQYKIQYNLPFPRYLINQTKKPVSLYDGAKRDAITYLSSGDNMPYAFQGKSGKWRYGKYQDKHLTAKNSNLTFACLIYGYLIDEKAFIWVYNYLLYALLCCIVCFAYFSFLNKRQKKTAKPIVYPYQQNTKNRIAEAEVAKYKHENHQLKIQNQQLQQQLTDEQKESKEAEYHKTLADLEKAESIVRDKDLELSTLQDSYNKLDQKYKEIIKDAKSFGLDYKNPRYKRILMGREYELRVAKSFYDSGCRLLEWTPDKGHLQGFSSEDSNNPDLVVSMDNKVFAVECKFRSNFISKKHRQGKGEINWADTKNVNHYQEFVKQRKIPTYIALGFRDEPDNPKNEYLVSLDELLICSEDPREVSDWGEQYIVIFYKLKHFEVESADYYRKLN